jgi:hypothetical protein
MIDLLPCLVLLVQDRPKRIIGEGIAETKESVLETASNTDRVSASFATRDQLSPARLTIIVVEFRPST